MVKGGRTHRENDSRCVELSTTAMFIGTPISFALASHACAAAWAALRVRVGLHLMVVAIDAVAGVCIIFFFFSFFFCLLFFQSQRRYLEKISPALFVCCFQYVYVEDLLDGSFVDGFR